MTTKLELARVNRMKALLRRVLGHLPVFDPMRAAGQPMNRMPPAGKPVAWGDHLKVGNFQIDAQHRAIFDIAMQLEDACRAPGDLEHIKGLARKLDKLLAAHFRYEEQQLAKADHPELKAHQAEHRTMLGELRHIGSRLDRMESDNDQLAAGFILYHFVLGVTVGHIVGSDVEHCACAAEGQGLPWLPDPPPAIASPK